MYTDGSVCSLQFFIVKNWICTTIHQWENRLSIHEMTNNAATKNESNVERHPRYIEEEGNMQYNM